MNKKGLLIFALWLATSACAAIAEDDNFYVGGAVGLSLLKGWDVGAMDGYYILNGYHRDTLRNSSNLLVWLYDVVRTAFIDSGNQLMLEGNVFMGYRMGKFANLEVGYSRDDNNYTNTYKSDIGSDAVWSKRTFVVRSTYAAILLKPFGAWYEGVYIKLGRHSSSLDIQKTIWGSPANLSAIAAGDTMPGDGWHSGYGPIVGLGIDISTSHYGAVRVELNRYNHLGGTTYGKSALILGYRGNF